MPDGALYFEQTYWPFLDGEEDIERIPEAFAETHNWAGLIAVLGFLISFLLTEITG